MEQEKSEIIHQWITEANMAEDIRERIRKANEPRPIVCPDKPVIVLPMNVTGRELKTLKKQNGKTLIGVFPHLH